ncbi:MAG: prenyltransferase/squalene oxidase repeat-containing protein [Thermoguttaceae bacterium]
MSYLGDLTLRLASGAMQLPEEFRRRHAAFLEAAHRPDGGFAGRQGQSDLYYTGFALRGLTLLGALSEQAAQKTAAFLRANLHRQLVPVDFLSLVFSSVLLEVTYGLDLFLQAGLDRHAVVLAALQPLRRPDGGFAKTAQSGRSSTYQSFLSVACLDLVGAQIDQSRPLVDMVRSRRRNDGGYAELDLISRSGTNPTAAAVGLLRLLQDGGLAPLDAAEARQTARFLAGMQAPDGGLRANTLIPISDLLSTSAGMVALADLDGLGAVDLAAVARYVDSIEIPAGGFRGGSWDSEIDTEYTFYGIATRCLLASLPPLSPTPPQSHQSPLHYS